MRKIVDIWRCQKCGKEYKEENPPKQCRSRGCKGNVVKMTVVRGC